MADGSNITRRGLLAIAPAAAGCALAVPAGEADHLLTALHDKAMAIHAASVAPDGIDAISAIGRVMTLFPARSAAEAEMKQAVAAVSWQSGIFTVTLHDDVSGPLLASAERDMEGVAA